MEKIDGSAAVKTIGLDDNGLFYCITTGQALDGEIKTFSRFKFGDIEAIESLSAATASYLVSQLEAGGGYREMFEQAANSGGFVYLQSPGIRNVASASYHLMESVAAKVNPWLANNGYPTMIKKPITRLASGIPNYAQLSSRDRRRRAKTTVSLMPVSDYEEYPINVIFIDDVEVTGCTKERAEHKALGAGALSFCSIFAYRVEAAFADRDASIENIMNQYAVKGGLDDVVADILSNEAYQPVQRMLRLLLNSSNRPDWAEFARSEIPNHSLLKIYLAAMSNDYHAISSNGELLYAASLEMLRSILLEEQMIDQSGVPS